MSGFGLYETLRLIIPGGLAVAVFSLMLRLAGGEGPLLAEGDFHAVIAALHGATFLFVSLVTGFLLYLVDIPCRARIYQQGDPENGYILPTDALRDMVEGTKHERKYFSLYFILSDGRLPSELHRRIYFFGGLYRIYFDARVTAAFAVAVGGPLALAIQGSGSSPFIGRQYLIGAIAILLVIALTVLVAESRHAVESMRKDGRSRTPQIQYPAAVLRNAYLARTAKGVAEILPASAIVCAFGIAGAFLCDASQLSLRVLGVVAALAAGMLWLMVELGPPDYIGTRKSDVAGPVRGRVLVWCQLKPSKRTQFTQLQRGVMDVALFGPAIVAAAVATELQGRSPTLVLLWAVLAVPASLVMAIRKHEQRLLAAYKDQVNWLQINESNVEKLARTGPGGDWF